MIWPSMVQYICPNIAEYEEEEEEKFCFALIPRVIFLRNPHYIHMLDLTACLCTSKNLYRFNVNPRRANCLIVSLRKDIWERVKSLRTESAGFT